MNRGTLRGFGAPVNSGKPLRTVKIKSGAGTFRPLMANSWVRVTLVGGGAGGGRSANASGGGGQGGGAGQSLTVTIQLPGPVSYAVGAGGLGATVANSLGTSGSNTLFGMLGVLGGKSDGTGGYANREGVLTYAAGPFIAGGGGGKNAGGVALGGRAPGFPTAVFTAGDADQPAITAGGGTANGGGGGGCSPYGRGGDGGLGSTTAAAGSTGADGAGYGAGGGGGGGSTSGNSGNGGNGSGGYIIVEELGP